MVQPKDNNAKNNSEWFYGLTWTVLTCVASKIGYVIGSEVNDDAVAAISGAVCGVTAGAVLAVYLHQPKGCLKVPYYSTVVLYREIMKVRGFWPEIITPKPA